MFDELIEKTLENPSQENVNELLKFIEEVSYSLLEDSLTYPFKSREYFEKRTEAFSVKKEVMVKFISSWVNKYRTTENFPIPFKTSPYEHTLNIPFQEIKKP
jgi:hypothetical protein